MALPTTVTVQDVADTFKISTQTVVKLIKEGKLPAGKVGYHYKIEEKDVIDFWNKRKQGK